MNSCSCFMTSQLKNAEWKKKDKHLKLKSLWRCFQDTKEMIDYYAGFDLPFVWTVEIPVQCVDVLYEVLSLFYFIFLLLAFTCLELHKVNVTGVCGSVNVFVLVCVLLQGAKLLQMSICRVHNPPEPTHICTSAPLTLVQTHAIAFTFPQAHAETAPEPQTFSRHLYRRRCPCCFIFFFLFCSSVQVYLHPYCHLHKKKTSHLFSSCHLDVAAIRSVIST